MRPTLSPAMLRALRNTSQGRVPMHTRATFSRPKQAGALRQYEACRLL